MAFSLCWHQFSDQLLLIPLLVQPTKPIFVVHLLTPPPSISIFTITHHVKELFIKWFNDHDWCDERDEHDATATEFLDTEKSIMVQCTVSHGSPDWTQLQTRENLCHSWLKCQLFWLLGLARSHSAPIMQITLILIK